MLAGWAASPARFREDANAEDDLARGAYRDRLLVELAQNASDAAGRGGRLVLRLDGELLTAANTGAPLDADGVRALSTLRASAKRDGRTVGRFGVGFAAVAAVSDDVVVASRSGAVRFSRALTRAAVSALPSVADELAARDGHVPLLRLPFPSDVRPALDTDVLVRLSDLASVRAQLDGLEATLLLVLPGLVELEVDGRRTTVAEQRDDVVLTDDRGGAQRWRVARGWGELDPALLARRPVEERSSTRWAVTWAVPVSSDGVPQELPPQVFRAPTPTDDPLSLPAVLAASLPLGPDRRRVADGPLRDAVLDHAAELLAQLLPGLADDPARLTLVPGPLGAGEVDAVLGSAVLRVLRAAPVLAGGRRPRDAVVLDGASPALVELLADLLPGLLPAAWSPHRWSAPLRALGVRRLDLPALVELLAGVDRPPGWWRRLYDVLPPDRDALGALPVPLADGRLAPGPRGLLMTDALVDLTPLGLRVVHPEAAAPLLLRLGAVEAEPRALLADPRVRAAVDAAVDEEDPAPVVEAVLALVGAADLRPGELPWLAALPLPDEVGDWRPAGELLLPDGPLARVVDRHAGFGVVRPGTAHDDVLVAVGALRSFATARLEDGVEDVDGLDDWLATLPPGTEPDLVVRDLDLVREDAWPEALELLARDGLLASSYVRWWLADAPVLAGRRPRDLRVPGGDPLLAGLYDEAPGDPSRAALLGARTSLTEVVAEDPDDVLDRLADPQRPVGRAQLRALYAALAEADVAAPDRVRAVVDGALEVVPAEDAVVVDRPDLRSRTSPCPVLPVPLGQASTLARALDVQLASEIVPQVALAGHAQPWSAVRAGTSGSFVQHDRLVVPDVGGRSVPVDWVVDGEVDHVVGLEGTARALAWRLGDWERRHALLASLRGDADADDADLDPV